MGLPWERLLAVSDGRMRSSAIRDLLAVTMQPEVISFAGGLPASDFFPVDGLRASFDAVIREQGAAALQYGPTEGHPALRAWVVEHLARRGIHTSVAEVLITTGSQQALDLLGKALLAEGSPLAVEAPSYVGALNAFLPHQPKFVPVPMDDQGLRVDLLDAALDHAGAPAALLYTVATFQNPSGCTMSLPRRHALISVATKRALPIVEDDPYGELRFAGEDVPPLRALPGGEETIYLGTFSKILAPGLRVGWVVAPRPLIERLVMAKQAADLHTDSLAQRALLHYCTHNDLAAHVEQLRLVYRERRDAMLDALARHLPSEARWTTPEGGLFVWVTLPPGVDSAALLRAALLQKVAFVPGGAFHVDGGGAGSMRLSFSHASPPSIEEGVRRLGEAVRAHARAASGSPVLAGS
ncbi:MAG TPA: PLP-dependent aminotransferase family protein [Chloroflexota bacterium]|nr:PLP-dependent aminotransferase family protein [Chloroflexota bacterium]